MVSVNMEVASGTSGNGSCTTCHENYYGKDCDQKVLCDTSSGICGEGCHGILGNGLCSSCVKKISGKLAHFDYDVC